MTNFRGFWGFMFKFFWKKKIQVNKFMNNAWNCIDGKQEFVKSLM